MPDIRECETGRRVVFQDPHKHERRHGQLIAAGPRFCFVWDSPSRSCLRVPTCDVEPDEDADDWSGCPSHLHSEG
jgi:hypothetical protein